MNNPLVSVIVPIYNVEAYLKRCVDSIIKQTYQNLEIILVDDGSPDNCPKMCDDFAQKDSRIVVVHKENGGLSSARNAGIKASKGEYLSFIDSDDYIKEDMIEKMLLAMTSTNSELSCCGRYVVYDDGAKEKQFVNSNVCTLTSTEALKAMLCGTYVGEPAWDKMYKKELFDDIEFPEGEINEDIVIMPLLFGKCNRIVHVPEAFYYYCKNGASITRSGYSPKKSIVIEHLEKIQEIIIKSYPSLLNDFYCFKAKYSLNMLYLLLEDKATKNKFYKDYQAYYANLKNHLFIFLKSKHVSKGDKIKALLVITNMYSLIRNLKKKVNR